MNHIFLSVEHLILYYYMPWVKFCNPQTNISPYCSWETEPTAAGKNEFLMKIPQTLNGKQPSRHLMKMVAITSYRSVDPRVISKLQFESASDETLVKACAPSEQPAQRRLPDLDLPWQTSTGCLKNLLVISAYGEVKRVLRPEKPL